MSQDISGFSTLIHIVASNTFPFGFTVTQASDDSDLLDFPSVQIGETAMGVNGDLIRWSRAQKLPMVVSVIPNSPDDDNLEALADANRVAQNKTSARDKITATVIYPDGSLVTLTDGAITDAPFGTGVSSAGRMKTKQYGFSFQQKV